MVTTAKKPTFRFAWERPFAFSFYIALCMTGAITGLLFLLWGVAEILSTRKGLAVIPLVKAEPAGYADGIFTLVAGAIVLVACYVGLEILTKRFKRELKAHYGETTPYVAPKKES